MTNAITEFEKYLDFSAGRGKLIYKKDLSLAGLCTFRIGGNADYVIWPLVCDEMPTLISMMQKCKIGYIVFGNGSNVLFDDEGFRGAAVFTTKLGRIEISGETVTAESGVPVTHLSSAAMKHSLTGLEFAYGIPGTCGGAVYMNAGAYNGEIKDVLEESTFFDPESGQFGVFRGEQNKLEYRKSVFTDSDKIILSAKFSLQTGDPDTIKGVMSDFMNRRIEKQPLEYPSAGSIFKRCPGLYTAKLIQDSGLKGLTVGGAQVSEKHSGFIINKGGATSADVLKLIEKVKEEIFRLNGIELECEVRYISPVLKKD